MLHVAPEPFLREILSKQFGKYETADLTMKDVDHHVDLQALPFADKTYDIVFASHVLEHIRDDLQAIREIRRILTLDGIAILPVPVICQRTVEYPEPNPHEAYHVRAPGWDYFDRYRRYFSRVDVYTSEAVPEKYQTFTYEDRTGWPTQDMPLRIRAEGRKHLDAVPVCYA
jgi:ubiquinone/menaquinone biosynthesis C-methylase UbiE